MSNWVRDGNFLETVSDKGDYCTLDIRRVRYINTTYNIYNTVVVRFFYVLQHQITEGLGSGIATFFVFYLSPYHHQKFRSACDAVGIKPSEYIVPKTFPTDPDCYYIAKISIGHTVEQIKIALTLLSLLNDFSSDFINEVSRLINHDPQGQHIIPQIAPPIQSQVDPDKKNDPALFRTMKQIYLNQHQEKLYQQYVLQLKILLSQGYDPNQTGRLLLVFALHLPLDVIKLLLCYGANPYYTDPYSKMMDGYPFIEIAQIENKPEHLNIVLVMSNKLEEPLCKVRRVEMHAENKQVKTHYEFEDDEIFRTDLKKSSSLTPQEHKQLFKVFKTTCFKDPQNNKAKLKYNYDSSFKTQTPKLIDVISYRKKDGRYVTAGGVLVEPVKLVEELKTVDIIDQNNIFVIHVEYSFLGPKYRGHLSMTLETYRIGNAVLVLASYANIPRALVPVFGSYTSVMSYLMVHRLNVPHGPKQRSAFIDELIKITLKSICCASEIVKDEANTLAVLEKVPIQSISYELAPSLYNQIIKEFFEILKGNVPNAYAAVMFFANHAYKAFVALCKRMAINYPEYNATLAQLIAETGLLEDYIGKPQLPVKKQCYLTQVSIFSGKRTQSNEVIYLKPLRQNQLRSCL